MEHSKHIYQTIQQNMTDLYTFACRMTKTDRQAEEVILKMLDQVTVNLTVVLKSIDVKVSLFKILYQCINKIPGDENPEMDFQTTNGIDVYFLFNHLEHTHKSVDQKINIIHTLNENDVKNLIDQLPMPIRPYFLLSLMTKFSQEQIASITDKSVTDVSDRLRLATKMIQLKIWLLLKDKIVSTVRTDVAEKSFKNNSIGKT